MHFLCKMFYFTNFVKPNGRVRFVKLFFDVTVLMNRSCLLGIVGYNTAN
jgi:hypothetical protein